MNILKLFKSLPGHLAPRFQRTSPAVADVIQTPTSVEPIGRRSRFIPDSGEMSIERERIQTEYQRTPVTTFFAPSHDAERHADLRFKISLRAAKLL